MSDYMFNSKRFIEKCIADLTKIKNECLKNEEKYKFGATTGRGIGIIGAVAAGVGIALSSVVNPGLAPLIAAVSPFITGTGIIGSIGGTWTSFSAKFSRDTLDKRLSERAYLTVNLLISNLIAISNSKVQVEKIKEARDLLLSTPCNRDTDTNKFLIAELFTELGICVDPIKQSSIQFQSVLEFLQNYQGHLKKIIDSTNIISIGFAIGFVIIESYHLSLILTDENELVQRLDAMIDNLNILINLSVYELWKSEEEGKLERDGNSKHSKRPKHHNSSPITTTADSRKVCVCFDLNKFQ
jgi:hypothetical protein